MSTYVTQPPAAPARTGSLKEILGGFLSEKRIAALPDGKVVWEGDDCAFLSPTRAGCYASEVIKKSTIYIGGSQLSQEWAGDSVKNTFTVASGSSGTFSALPPAVEDVPTSPMTGGGTYSISGQIITVTNPVVGSSFTYTTAGAPPKKDTGIGEQVNESIDVGPFAGYAGVECWLGGDEPGPSYEERAKSRLETNESAFVEGRLASWALDPSVSIGTAPSLTDAIAALEDMASLIPHLLIMSPGDAIRAHAQQALIVRDGILYTPTGIPVLAAYSVLEEPYPRGKIAAVGWPTIWASDITVSLGREIRENTALAIAERAYIIGVACRQFHVNITVAP